jgi:hypothetical protein
MDANVQRRTLNVQRPNDRARPPGAPNKLRNRFPGRCRFAIRTDNRAGDDHFDQAANACVNEQFSWKRLDGVNAHPHADRCDFQQNAQADSCDYTATTKTRYLEHHERKNDESLADQNPMKKLSISVCVRQRFGVCA